MPINIGQGINFGGGISIITPPQTNIPVQSGLVMQLDATNPLSYSGTGTTVTDLTGGYNHTLTDANMFVNSGGIKYFQFDEGGTTKKMNVSGTGPVLNSSGNGYTYMVWAYTSNPSSKFLMSGNVSNTPSFGVNSNPDYVVVDNTGSFQSLLVSAFGAGGVWQQLTYTVDVGDTVALLINNSQVGGRFIGGGMSGGRRHLGFGNRANWGRVAICCLYNRVLSNAEVSTNFNGLKGFFGL